jgi:hypothetical protein
MRTILVWVLALALPLQGVAASTMLHCGPSHARMTQGPGLESAARVESGTHEGHSARSSTGHSRVERAQPDSHHSEHARVIAQHDSASDGASLSYHGKVSCSACAVCCSAVVMSGPVAMPDLARGVHTLNAASEALGASYMPDGLDKPPRRSTT